MSKLEIRPGSTSVSVDIFVYDSSVSTGAGLIGLAYNTASLTAYYKRNGNTAPVAITLATLAAITTAWSSGGFIAADGTNTPGLYRLDIPDAALATGVRSVTIMLKGATNMAPCLLEIDLNAETNVWGWHGSDLLTGVGAFRRLGIIDSGTAQAATGTTLQMRSAATFANSEVVGSVVNIYSGSAGAGQSKIVNASVGSTDTLTVDTFTTTPTGTILYDLYASPTASTTLLPGVDIQTIKTQTVTAAAGVTFPTSIASPTNITAASGIVLSGVTHTGAVIPTVTTTGTATNVTTVNGLAANVITAAATATDFGAEVAAAVFDLPTTGHTTAATFGAQLKTVLDTVNTTTQAISTAVDTEVAGIKAKTDYLPGVNPGSAGGLLIAGSNADTTVNIIGNITGNVSGSIGSVTNPVTADTTKVRGQTLTGTGTELDPWRPA